MSLTTKYKYTKFDDMKFDGEYNFYGIIFDAAFPIYLETPIPHYECILKLIDNTSDISSEIQEKNYISLIIKSQKKEEIPFIHYIGDIIRVIFGTYQNKKKRYVYLNFMNEKIMEKSYWSIYRNNINEPIMCSKRNFSFENYESKLISSLQKFYLIKSKEIKYFKKVNLIERNEKGSDNDLLVMIVNKTELEDQLVFDIQDETDGCQLHTYKYFNFVEINDVVRLRSYKVFNSENLVMNANSNILILNEKSNLYKIFMNNMIDKLMTINPNIKVEKFIIDNGDSNQDFETDNYKEENFIVTPLISEKEEDKEKKKHKKPFNKNKADAFNLGKRRSENIIDYRFNMNDISNKNEQNNDDLDNSRTSKKNLKFGSSYDKYLKNLKYNFKVDKNKKSNLFNKTKRNSMFDKKDIFSSYFKNKNEDKNTSQNKNYNYNDYEKPERPDKYDKYDKYDDYDKYDNYNEYNKENQYDVKGGIDKYDKYYDEYKKNNENNRYDEYEKKVKYDEYPKYDNDYDEKNPNNENDNKNKEDKYKVNDNKENYDKINIGDEYKEKEDKIKTNKKKIKDKFNTRLSLNKETKYETFKKNITDDKYFKNIMNKKEKSIQGRYKYKYKYIGNRDKNVSEVSDSKQNRWMKKKTNINYSIISRSKNGDFEESQEISRNTWLKKRLPITGLHKNVFGNSNRNQNTRNNLIKNLKMKRNSLGKTYEKHEFKDFEFDNYKDKLSKSNNFDNDMIKSSINIIEKKEKNNFNLMKNDNDNDDDANKLFVNTKKIGSDIYNINYGKIVNKNMYINVYKTEPKNNNNYPENQKFVEKRGNDENNIYNYTQNYYNIYQDEDDDNILGEYGTKLVGKEMLKKNIRDKEERERLSKQNINIYSSI